MSTGLDCTFARAGLVAALDRLAGVLPQRTTLPVLETARITRLDGGEAVRIEATDAARHAEVSVPLPAACGEFEPLCVKLDTLLSLAKVYDGITARLKANGDGVEFSCGSSKAKLPVVPAKDFPQLRFEEVGFEEVGGGDAAAFRATIARVTYAICAETTKPALLGVNFGANGNGFVAIACNGALLATERLVEWQGSMSPATLPTAGVRALMTFFPTAVRLTISAGGSRFRFTDEGGATLTFPSLDDPYPNVEQIVSRDSDIEVRVDRAALANALKRVNVVLRSEQMARAAFSFSRGGIAIHAPAAAGTADEFVPANVEGGDVRIGFNTGFLLDTLASLTGTTVFAEMKHPERASLWRDETGSGLRLVMPLRLSF